MRSLRNSQPAQMARNSASRFWTRSGKGSVTGGVSWRNSGSSRSMLAQMSSTLCVSAAHAM